MTPPPPPRLRRPARARRLLAGLGFGGVLAVPVGFFSVLTIRPAIGYAHAADDGGAPLESAGAEAAAPVAPPRAQSTTEARRRFMRGERLFQMGRYSDAAREYERGYRLAPLPGFLINIAHCHVRRGHLHQAREIYLQFLDAAPTSPRRPEVERAIAAIDRAIDPLKALELEDMPASPPVLATASASTAPRISLAPPPVLVTPPRSPRDQERKLGLGGASLRGLELRRPAAVLARDDVRPKGSESRASWMWPVVGGVAAGLITGAAVILIGRGTNDDGIRRGDIGNLTR